MTKTQNLLILLCASVIGGTASATETTATWLGSGNYLGNTNWDIGQTPINGSPTASNTYAVIINNGNISLNTPVTVDSLLLTNATLTVSGSGRTITANTTFGPGAVIGGGTLGLAGTVALTATGSDLYLNLNGGAQITNTGTFTHTASGSGQTGIIFNANNTGSSVFDNAASGVFDANTSGNNASLGYGGVNAGNVFLNEGTFNKTGTHDYAANVAFKNTGTVNVQQGSLSLDGGDGGATSGAYAVSPGATLAVGSGLTFVSGGSISGAGTVQLNSGSAEFDSGSNFSAAGLNILSGKASFLSGATLGTTALTMSGGTLELDIDHSFNAASLGSGATIIGTGHATFAGTTSLSTGNLTFGGSGLKEFSGTTAFAAGNNDQFLNIDGGTEVRNTGSFTVTRGNSGNSGIILNADNTGGASVFRNATGATFTANMASGDGSVGFGGATTNAGNAFINEGSFIKTGSGIYALNVALNNSGTVAVQNGTLNANAGGTASGSYALSSGTTFGLNGTQQFQTGSSISGAGTVIANGGTTTFQSGSSFSAASLKLPTGTLVFQTGSTLGTTALTLSGGTLQLDIDHTFTGAAISGGGITGAGHVTFASPTFTQNSYSFGDGGVKEFTGTTTLDTTFVDQFFNVAGGAEVKNSGTFTQQRDGSGQSQIVLNADSAGGLSTFLNASGATFDAVMNGGAGGIGAGSAGAGNKFINQGTFNKSGYSDYAVNTAFANSGSVSLQQGNLAFNAGDGGSTTGTFSVASGSYLVVNGGFSFGSGSAVSGSGIFQSNGGTTAFNSGSSFTAATLTIAGGTTSFGTGSTLGSATTLNLNAGTLEMDVDHTFNNLAVSSGATISGSGATTLAGSLSLDGKSLSIAGSGTKKLSGTTSFTAGATDSYLNIDGGGHLTNIGIFTQTRDASGQSQIVLNADSAGGSSIFQNAVGATFNAAMTGGDGGISAGGVDSSAEFLNLGAFSKSGSHDYDANVPFANSGSVNITQGNLALNAGDNGSTTGTFSVSGGASLIVNGGFSFGNGSAISGGGTFQTNGGTTSFNSGSSFTASTLDVAGGTTSFAAGSSFSPSTSLTMTGGTLEMDTAHTFANATLSSGATLAGSGATNFSGTVAVNAASIVVAGAGVKTFSGTTTFSPGATNSFLNIAGGSAVVNTGSFTQNGSTGGASGLILASDGTGPSTFENAKTFTANVASGSTGTIGYGGSFNANNKFINSDTFTKTGDGTYQINVPVDNSGKMEVSQGTLSVTAGVTNNAGTLVTDNGTTLNLSENANASSTGTLIHNGSSLNLGANNLTVAKDYQNSASGSGNNFNNRANVTGTGQILAATGTRVAYGSDASSGSLQFGVVHIGDTATKNYTVQNTGTSNVTVRGAVQTTVGGASITDSRLGGAGLSPGNFAAAPGSASGAGAVTFTPSTPGPLSGQQLHVATNFDNVTLPNLAIQGTANYYASPVLSTPTNTATLTKLSPTSYQLDFGTINVGAGTTTANLSLLNSLQDAVYQDVLNGSFATGGVTHFTLSGFGNFADIASGDSDNDFLISVDPSAIGGGHFSDTLTFNPTSANASNTSSLNPIQIAIEATVDGPPNPTPTPTPVPTPTPIPGAPGVKITGKAKINSSKSRLVIRGTTTGTVTMVVYKVNKTKGVASGTSNWQFGARLAVGKNTITVTAIGPGGSTNAKVTVIRK